jgi:hypothetical protein
MAVIGVMVMAVITVVVTMTMVVMSRRPGSCAWVIWRWPRGEREQLSYGLKMLRLAGLVSLHQDGRMVFDRLSDGFPRQLLEHCLRQLFTIASPEAGDARA